MLEEQNISVIFFHRESRVEERARPGRAGGLSPRCAHVRIASTSNLSPHRITMAKGGHHHRATLAKDKKPFKSRHATKGQLKNITKGKVEKSAGGNKAIKVQTKLERKNLTKQLRDQKVLETKLTRKLFEGSQGAEKIIVVLSLTHDVSPSDIASRLINLIRDGEEPLDFVVPSVTSLRLNRFKSNVKVIVPDHTNLLAIMDAAKVADYVIFGLSAEQEVDPAYGEQILRTTIAQGIASPVGVVTNLVSAYPKKNLQQDIRQSLTSYFTHFFPNEDKLYALENENECINCIRTIGQKFPKGVTWRDSRAYLVADEAYWHPQEDSGYVVVEGIVRGIGFNANRLVHIAGYGDFQVDRIEKITKAHGMDLDDDAFVPGDDRETLEELNPEEVEMDQYDYDDLDESVGIRMDGKNYFVDGPSFRGNTSQKLPRGTSEYQSKWLLDDVLEGASDLEDEPGEVEMDAHDDDVMDDVSEYQPTEAPTEMHVELSAEEEQRQLEEHRAMERDELEFPDEIELRPDESAKEALSAYRGIKSLGGCQWDHDEVDVERPSIWKRLLRISNYKATRNRVAKEAIREAQVLIGTRARLFIRAPQFVLDGINTKAVPFTIYSLLQHEHKLSVANFSFESWEDYEKPIPSKETLIVQYGPRRQVIQPIFNQASNNANNVHKHERFAHHGGLEIATTIAPVLFNNAPAIFFKAKPDGSIELVGQGTFLNCDHTRVVAERSILTGHPVKIHKRLVTVRYMFFNTEDINWFKAVPLFTKSGRTGFIKESLGTHGYYKATFDGKLTSQDVVAMALYKRVWPAISSAWTA